MFFIMPAIVGAVKINSIGTAGVFNIGDVYAINPESIAKTFAGSGSFNTGNNLRVRNDYSQTNVYDLDEVDQNIIGAR